MKRFLLYLCMFCFLIVSPTLVILTCSRFLLNININAFWGVFGLMLFPASLKAFNYIDDNFKEDKDKQDNKEVNSQS